MSLPIDPVRCLSIFEILNARRFHSSNPGYYFWHEGSLACGREPWVLPDDSEYDVTETWPLSQSRAAQPVNQPVLLDLLFGA